MNYQSLIYFKTVAELQHYTKAADALFITQPALSKAIRNLEIELGVALFQKDGRNVMLTRYGELFYTYVKQSVAEINDGIAAVHHLRDVENNTICLAALTSMYWDYLPARILQFRALHPSCRFNIEYKMTSNVLDNIVKGVSELGICSDISAEDADSLQLETRILYKEPVGLIVSKTHPFAGRESIQVEDLKNEKFVVYLRSARGTNKILHDICAPFGFEPNIISEAYSDAGVIGAVAVGDGISIIPTSISLNTNNVVFVRLDTPEPMARDVNLVWRRGKALPPLAGAFRDMLINAVRQ